MKRFRTWQVIALITVGTAHVGLAQRPSPAAQRWRNQVAESSTLLKTGEHAKALKIADHVISDMIERLGDGTNANKLLAIVLSHKALANAGLGRNEDALWYWYVALDLYPQVAETDMSVFGLPGEFLKRHATPPEHSLEKLDSANTPAGITPPHVLKKVDPKFPPGARAFRIVGEVIVQVVIDKNGLPTQPRILKPLPAPTLPYVALEAVKRWRFQPGKLDGEPVDVVMNLAVRFKL